jgi:glutamate N-acetyltransferase/amino-acid N-acetyltransferase
MSYTCRGFRFAATSAGIKSSGQPDLALIACDRPARAAAVFTRNRVKAAPVRLSQANLRRSGGLTQAVIVNSGNANACTGRRGLADARRMATLAAEQLGTRPEQVQVASTGVIGKPLPVERIERAMPGLVADLGVRRFSSFAEAILTTDKSAKVARRTATIHGTRVTLIGCTKGAGMIAPDMATTLTFVTTDAELAGGELAPVLRQAADATFNAIAVDGDTSTNDTLLLLASGAAENRRTGAAARLAGPLEELLAELAAALMRDGEGVHHVVRLSVRGARSEAAARAIARRMATSPLVKTAIAGGDPNWGRLLCAAGNAGVPLRPERIDLSIGPVQLVAAGCAVADPAAERRAARVMRQPGYEIVVDLNDGTAGAHYLACDLSHEYVSINADYRS